MKVRYPYWIQSWMQVIKINSVLAFRIHTDAHFHGYAFSAWRFIGLFWLSKGKIHSANRHIHKHIMCVYIWVVHNNECIQTIKSRVRFTESTFKSNCVRHTKIVGEINTHFRVEGDSEWREESESELDNRHQKFRISESNSPFIQFYYAMYNMHTHYYVSVNM